MKKAIVIVFAVLLVLGLAGVWHHHVYERRVHFANHTHAALRTMMIDLVQARGSTIRDVPADGQWHHRISFNTIRQEALRYAAKDGKLYRVDNGQVRLVSDDVGDLRIRRLHDSPGLLEVQVAAMNNDALVSNLKIRVSH